MRFNPFNYTKPLAGSYCDGRAKEVDDVDYYVGEAARGNLMNFAVLGSPQIGKTSLLNYARHKAKASGITCVEISPWECSETDPNIATTLVLSRLLSALNDRLRVTLVGPAETNVNAGELEVPGTTDPEGDTSLIVLGSEDLLTSVQAVFNRIPTQRAMVTLDDVGSPETVNVLKQLLQLTERLPIFLAIGAIDTFFGNEGAAQGLSAFFIKIRLAPFESPVQTYRVIQAAIERAEDPDEDISFDFDTIEDIHILSGGNPREICLISHCILKAYAANRIHEFEITSDVLDEILGQLGDLSKQDELEKIKMLNNEEVGNLAQLASQEGLSVHQMTLLRLAFGAFDDNVKLDTESEVSEIVDRFSEAGLIDVVGDSFEISGADWAKVYLSYRHLRQVGDPFPIPRTSMPSYSNLIIEKLKDHISKSIPHPSKVSTVSTTSSGQGLNQEFSNFLEIINQGDPIQLTRSNFFFPLMGLSRDGLVARQISFIYLPCSCSASDEDYSIEFVIPENGGKTTSSLSLITDVIDSLSEILPLYGLHLGKVEERILPPEQLDKSRTLVTAFTKIRRTYGRFTAAFDRGDYVLAEHLADDNVNSAQSLNEEIKSDWVVKRSFVQICNGFENEAVQPLQEVASVDFKGNQTILAKADLAYIYMEKADYQLALEILEEIHVQIRKSEDVTNAILKLSFGHDDLLRPLGSYPDYNLIKDVSLQAVVDCMIDVVAAKNDDFPRSLLHLLRARRLENRRSFPRRVEARVFMLRGEHELAKRALAQAMNLEPLDDGIDLELRALFERLREEP